MVAYAKANVKCLAERGLGLLDARALIQSTVGVCKAGSFDQFYWGSIGIMEKKMETTIVY